MEIRLLGPVEVCGASGPVSLGPPQQRCVLGVLALDPRRPISPSNIVDRVWAGRAPSAALGSLYAHIARLRKTIEPLGGRIARRSGGYLLDLDPEQVDLARARRLAAEARLHVADSQVAGSQVAAVSEHARAALGLFRAACDLWAGTPLSGIKGDWASRVREALHLERLALLIDRFEWQLRLGGHAEAIAPLTAEQAAYPLAEPLAGLGMIALYRAGRQAEALAAYARIRQRIVAEVGDEPGAPLRDLHARILRRDPTLDLHAPDSAAPEQVVAAVAGPPPEASPSANGSLHTSASSPGDGASAGDASSAGELATVVPALLPRDVPGFVGRGVYLWQLTELVTSGGSGATVLIEGSAGVGKTALAVHWAHRIADRFPDGRLYVDLQGYVAGPPMAPLEALTLLLHALGVSARDMPVSEAEARGTYRSLTVGRRMLVLLDNAISVEQVRPLMPGAGCAVLVTSREELTGFVAREGAQPVKLDTLSPEASVALLTSLLGPDRVAAEPDETAAVAELCGHLPLALRIAAARLASRPRQRISAYLSRLRESDRLAALAVPGDDQSAVRPAFDISYSRLRDDERRLFRLMALAPGGDLDRDAAAALVDLPSDRADSLLDSLAAANLVEERRDGRFGLHDLLRCYAAERARQEDPEDQRQAALGRLYDHHLLTCVTAVETLYPHTLRLPSAPKPAADAAVRDAATALAWLDAERSNLVACVTHAAATPSLARYAWLIADVMRAHLQARGQPSDWQTVAGSALSAARAHGDLQGQASAQLSLARMHWSRGSYRDAVHQARQVVALAHRSQWPDAAAAAHVVFGALHQRSGRLQLATTHLTQALASYQQSGRRHGELAAHATVGVVLMERGRLHEAISHTRAALRLHAELGSRRSEGFAIGLRGEINRLLGHFPAALEDLSESNRLARAIGDRSGEGYSLRSLAELHCLTGRLPLAHEAAEQALAIARETGNHRLEAEATITLTRLQRDDGDAAAVEHGRQAVGMARESGNRYPEAEALVALAETQLALDTACGQALVTARQALATAQEAGFRLLEGQAWTVMAAIHLTAARYDDCVTDARNAVIVHRETRHRPGEIRARALLDRAAAMAGC